MGQLIVAANSIPQMWWRETPEGHSRVWGIGLPLADRSVQTIVTSPPYWGLRTYDPSGIPDPDEFGAESLKHYVSNWLLLCSELWRVLRDDGLLWLNLGDTAAGSGGAGGDHKSGGTKQHIPKFRQGDPGLPPMQFCNVPHRVATAMQDSGLGWRLRSQIVWNKTAQERCSLAHVRRPRQQYEMIFMFSKGRAYKFYPKRLAEAGNIWQFPPNRTGDKGSAPFPDELAERCILPSTDPGDVVFDPFVGSGTTTKVADRLGRHGVGIDLYAGKAS